MKRYIRDRGALVRLPRPLHEAAGRLPKERERLTRRLGRTPSDDELAEAVGVSPAEVAELEAALRAPSPEQRRRLRADPRAYVSEDRLLLAGAFEALDDQEREIVFLRFVEDLDRKEVAGRLGISESQLGRRTRAALAKLRNELEEDGLQRAANGEAAAQQPPESPHRRRPRSKPPNRADTAAGCCCACRAPSTTTSPRRRSARASASTASSRGRSQRRSRGSGRSPASGDARPESSELEAREVPRWLPAAIVANIVVVVVAALVAIVLLVIAWQNGW